MAAVEEHDEDVIELKISADSSVQLWPQLAEVLSVAYDAEAASVMGVMGSVAELFCCYPEQMYAWWQLMKSVGQDWNDDRVLTFFGVVIQDHYERGLMRVEVVR